MGRLDAGGKGQKQLEDDDFGKYFEALLRTALRLAFVTNAMYRLIRCVGAAALMWASIAILGLQVTDLSEQHYFSVGSLVLLGALQLSCLRSLFGRSVNWKLVRRAGTSVVLQSFITYAVHSLLMAVHVALAVRRLQDVRGLPSKYLKTSLGIFYALVLLNGSLTAIYVAFSVLVVPRFVATFCLSKYYEKVVWSSLHNGPSHAADLDTVAWAFQMQADEYRRNQSTRVVKELHGDLMKYLYYHPRSKGFQAATVAMESDDVFEREAAANIVGCWAQLVSPAAEREWQNDPRLGSQAQYAEAQRPRADLTTLVMQKKLLGKLAEALEKNDETGHAASVSFQALVDRDPEGMLGVRSAGRKKEMLSDILMDRIHAAIKSDQSPNRAITDIKVLIPLLPFLINNSHGCSANILYCTKRKLDIFKQDMWVTVSNYTKGLKRLQAVAAYAYSHLMTKEERTIIDLRGLLLMEPTAKVSYMLRDEFHYLLKLLEATDFPSEWNTKVKLPDEITDWRMLT